MFFVVEGAAEELGDLRCGKRIEDVNLRAREKRRDDFERRILGGGADKDNVARFDVREKGVLLGFVEAVNFVDEDDGAVAAAGFLFGDGHDFLDFLDARENGAERDKFRTRQARDETRERRFSAARRSPEKHGAEIVVFDLNAQGFARAEKFFLADEFIERARAHALGERLIGGGNVGLSGVRKMREEAHGWFDERGTADGWMCDAGNEFLWRAAS